MRPLTVLVTAILALGCGRGGRAQAAANGGAAGFTAYPAGCTNESCRTCAAHLGQLWSRRAEPASRNAFRVAFSRAPADARDTFAVAQHPDGTVPFEHCTAGLAPGSACATYSTYCVGVIADALRSGDTPMPWRVQLDVAVGKSCDRSRDEIVARLRACAPFDDATTCESGGCTDCLARHLAAITVLAPVIDREDRLAQLVALADGTPETVLRAAVEALGAPDPPADIEPATANRGLRHDCLSLLRRSAAPAPFACGAVLTPLLTSDAYADAPRAWSDLGAARPAVRAAVLDALLGDLTTRATPPAATLAKLRALPPAETADALRRALARVPITPGAYAGLRAELARAAPGAALPPETPPAPSTPTTAPAPSLGGGLPRPRGPAATQG